MLPYRQSLKKIVAENNTNIETGLTTDEAQKRLNEFGENVFEEQKQQTIFSLLFEQINTPLIYILIGAAVISLIVREISDAIIILLVIILNAVIGVFQESKAEKSLDELKKISTPKAIVKRDNNIQEIPSFQLVPGDVVLLDAGRIVPADLRLIESAQLKIEESSLTGESMPVEKDAKWTTDSEVPLGERSNSAFMSTVCTYGRGTGVVVSTGMETEIGKIAHLLGSQEKELTPLQKKLAQLGKLLGIATIIICLLIFLIGFIQGRDPLEILLIAVSLAVAAIPEGLPAIVTIVLAIGVQKMIKRHAIVRKLPAVETLGAVSVICSDKTGTLTKNKMTVTNLFINDKHFSVEQFSPNNETSELFFKSILLCNDATVSEDEKTGDPTEVALVDIASQFGFNMENIKKQYKRIYEIPFDSERKMMTTVHEYNDKLLVVSKGALESILNKTTQVEINNNIQEATPDKLDLIKKHATDMSHDALRVLAVGYKIIEKTTNYHNLESNLTFLGLTGMIDPPREEVKQAIKQCQQAGIKAVMITGDHQETAFAIARELGITNDVNETFTGAELNELSESELADAVKNTRVFARVSPEHKVQIVKAFKQNNKVVAMTGDGVNDAPSLKQADVGIAMGITGTDVAKGASDIILTDDNFATITAAVEEGRNVYKNIKKSILFLLSCNLGEIFALFIGIMLGWPAPLTAVQILWVNLVTDTLPAIALGVDPDDPDIMDEEPRHYDEKIITKQSGIYTVLNGLLIGMLTLFAFLEGIKFHTNASSIFTINFTNLSSETIIFAQTIAFATLSISQLLHTFNLRHETKSIFKVGLFTNRFLIWSVLIGISIQITIIMVPRFSKWFHIHSLNVTNWIFIFIISIVPIIINEFYKLIKRNLKTNNI